MEPHNYLISKLKSCGYRVDNKMHRGQESIEAQLPFLQVRPIQPHSLCSNPNPDRSLRCCRRGSRCGRG